VVVFPDDQGRDTLIREEDHGAIVDIIHLHFIAIGREDPEVGVEFSYEAKRLLALLQIGANAERVLHAEIDRVFEKVEELVPDQNGEALERLRKEFT